MNKIRDWDRLLPTRKGVYLCCFGDVETPDTLWLIEVTSVQPLLYTVITDTLSGKEGEEEELTHTGVKFAKLSFT